MNHVERCGRLIGTASGLQACCCHNLSDWWQQRKPRYLTKGGRAATQESPPSPLVARVNSGCSKAVVLQWYVRSAMHPFHVGGAHTVYVPYGTAHICQLHHVHPQTTRKVLHARACRKLHAQRPCDHHRGTQQRPSRQRQVHALACSMQHACRPLGQGVGQAPLQPAAPHMQPPSSPPPCPEHARAASHHLPPPDDAPAPPQRWAPLTMVRTCLSVLSTALPQAGTRLQSSSWATSPNPKHYTCCLRKSAHAAGEPGPGAAPPKHPSPFAPPPPASASARARSNSSLTTTMPPPPPPLPSAPPRRPVTVTPATPRAPPRVR